MSLATQLSAAFTRVGVEIKAVRGTLGANSSLSTTAKDTLVNAINEVNGKPNTAINDAAASASSVYSSNKTNALVATKIDYAVSQTLTAPQQAQAIANIGGVSAANVGDTAHDFTADFTSALV